jgi:hypothetical protein
MCKLTGSSDNAAANCRAAACLYWASSPYAVRDATFYAQTWNQCSELCLVVSLLQRLLPSLLLPAIRLTAAAHAHHVAAWFTAAGVMIENFSYWV